MSNTNTQNATTKKLKQIDFRHVNINREKALTGMKCATCQNNVNRTGATINKYYFCFSCSNVVSLSDILKIKSIQAILTQYEVNTILEFLTTRDGRHLWRVFKYFPKSFELKKIVEAAHLHSLKNDMYTVQLKLKYQRIIKRAFIDWLPNNFILNYKTYVKDFDKKRR